MKKYHNKAVSKILCAVLAFFTLVTAAAYAAEYSVASKTTMFRTLSKTASGLQSR